MERMAGSYSCLLCPPRLQLLFLLLEALSCPDRVVQLSTLSCLQPLLLEAPQIMSLHVDTLVTKFLSLTSSPTMVCAAPPFPSTPLLCPCPSCCPHPCLFQAVRIAALRCAHALTSLPTPVVSASACRWAKEVPDLLLGSSQRPALGESLVCSTAAPVQGQSYPGTGQAFG